MPGHRSHHYVWLPTVVLLAGCFLLTCGTEPGGEEPLNLELDISPNPVMARYTSVFSANLSDSGSEPHSYTWKLQGPDETVTETTTAVNYLYWTAPQDTGTYSHSVQVAAENGVPLTEEEIFTVRVVPRQWQPADPFYEEAELLYSIANEGLFLMDVETGETRLISEKVGGARWSPEGDRIAVTGVYEKEVLAFQIFVMNADGTNKWLLTRSDWFIENGPSPYNSTGPVWSPDGNHIAYKRCNCEVGGDYDIVIANLDTTSGFRETIVTDNRYNDSVKDWLPDGTTLLIQSAEQLDGSIGRIRDLYSIEVSGSNKKTILKVKENFGIAFPRFSPNGRLISFVGGTAENHQIYIMNSDGSNITQVTDDDNIKRDLSWLPDGSGFIFTILERNDINSPRSIYMIQKDGMNLSQVTNQSGNYSQPEWRPKRD